MDQFCPHCGAMDGFAPDDHECIETIRKQIANVTRGISSEAGWDSLTRDGLLKDEAELTRLYEALRDVTSYFSDQVQAALRRRDAAYSAKQNARKPLNAARAEVRRRMEDAET